MLLVVCAVGVVLVIGWAMQVPMRLRLGMIAAIWALVVLSLLVLPEGPLRQALGGDVRGWLALGVVVALGLTYRAAIAALRHRAAPPVQAEAPLFRPAELERYSRHILLRDIGGPGQARLKQARVLVIGAGGLGSPALLYLAAAGVGQISVIDPDQVEGSNLQRQIIHADDRIGMPKVHSAAAALRALNPFIEVRPYQRRLDAENAAALIAEQDLVLDGTDNFDTRYLVNRICVEQRKPLISAAMTQWEGQISLYHPAAGGPCYECVFPERPAPGMVPACAEAGVVAALPGILGSLMAMEAIKHLTGAGTGLRGRLMIHDALYAETRTITVKPRPDCPVCGGRHG